MDKPAYQVLARKWRPQHFDAVVGQKHVVQTLANALDQGRIAHAYCFSGIRGVGKTTIARLLAKGLNCRAVQQPTSKPCGQCESCLEIEQSRSLDVVELDAASQSGVENIRELTEVTRYAPSRDRYRVFIIDEAHMLSPAAFNALLKTLEEPPAHVVFVLATTEATKILPTVLSRCQHYQFGRISQRDISGHLARMARAENITISDDGLALIATAADGSLRDAQSLLDKLIAFAGDQIDEQTVIDLLGLIDRVLLLRVTDLIVAQDLAGVLGFVNEMVESGVDLHQFTIDLLGHVRNLLIVRTVKDPGEILHLPDSDVARLAQQAKGFEVDDLDRAFSLIAANEYRIKTAAQPRYHLEVVLSRLARMPKLEPIEKLIAAFGGEGPEPVSGGRAGQRPTSTGESESAAIPQAAPAPAQPVTPELPQEAAPAPTQEAVTEPPPEMTPAPREQKAAEPQRTVPERAPASGLLRNIQEQVDELNPLIGPILGRTSAISLSGETIVFQFPASANLFAERVSDPEALELLSTAAEAVLGRRVIARVEIDPQATRGVPTTEPTTPVSVSDEPPVPSAGTAQPSPGAAHQPDAAVEPAQSPVSEPASEPSSLRQRAENEPLVQEFVKALKGQITSVEEL